MTSLGKQDSHFSSFHLLHLPSGPSRPADKSLILVDSTYSLPGSYKQVIYTRVYTHTHTQKEQYLCIYVYISTYFIAIVQSLSHIRPFCNPMNCKRDRPYLLHFADKESEGQGGEVTPEAPCCACLRARREARRKLEERPGLARPLVFPTAHSPHSVLLNISPI